MNVKFSKGYIPPSWLKNGEPETPYCPYEKKPHISRQIGHCYQLFRRKLCPMRNPLQASRSSVPPEIDDQPGPYNIRILPQKNVQPEPVTITTSTLVRISEQPHQSAIDQGNVSQAATLTINSGKELQSTPEKTNA
ncbi:hypothetical protein WA026_012982 [Henosepilachna vigintioctopunctata]|uniref:Uncharacterized protein n=1 Tax=Henosepilachna vigintioctopunctata TaxID=420089 RepID=A0AAW1TK77_9CUCU